MRSILKRFVEWIALRPRYQKVAILVAFDFVVLTSVLWLAYIVRLNTFRLPATLDEWALIVLAPMIAIPIFIRMGIYRAIIRYLPERALWTILQAVTLSVLGWVFMIILLEVNGRATFPRSVPLIYWAMAVVAVGGSRFAVKALMQPLIDQSSKGPAIAIVGAGEAAMLLAQAIRRHGRQQVVAFVDHKPGSIGRDLAGIRVWNVDRLSFLIQQFGIQEVIISDPTLSPEQRRSILKTVNALGARIRTLPPLTDVASGKYIVSQIREIDIDELLGRSAVPADPELIKSMITGRSIMVTGAGGSIGSELCRLVANSKPQRLVLFEANEFALYQIERELANIQDLSLVPVLGSVTNAHRVRQALDQHGVSVVFHAAAHKHVPLVEANALEGIFNNVYGTNCVVQEAAEAGVQDFVLISTDKAVRPTNVMGATKRWAELIVRQKAIEAKAAKTGQRFSAVRFGNVLGSNGSVVPLFKDQIKRSGPITLTDPGMTRYFMSIHEAAELIVQAGALAQGGDVFLLDMGEPVLIRDLATNMIRLAGLNVRDENNPNGDIEIVVTGKRPGEKMYEELFYDSSSAKSTRHPKILRGPSADATAKAVQSELLKLREALDEDNEREARRILFDFISE
jgi:FlaA1/EpsC-like NDP-sugar epimerase